jgi:glutathione synthase/RimK-type ligase-like ATP-grasp enzyme
MKPCAVVVGMRSDTSLARDLTERFGRRGVEALFFDDWAQWRVALYPHCGDFSLYSERLHRRLTRPQVKAVLFFGMPSLPDADPADRTYQALEFDALMFGLLFVAAPAIASRWSYVVAGFSDTPQRTGTRLDDPLELASLSTKLIRCGATAAFIYRGDLYYLTHAGLVESTSVHDGFTEIDLPITLEFDSIDGTFTPLVGVVPEWLPPGSRVLERVVDGALEPGRLVFRPLGTGAPASPPGTRTLFLVAHRQDSTAIHVAHRARLHGLDVSLIDLSFLYSEKCDDNAFSAGLRAITDADVVYARPLLIDHAPYGQGDIDRFARHVKIVRALQFREKATLNRSAAGHTNISKSAQIASMMLRGFSVPPSLATNDDDAARAFLVDHPSAVFKSGSWSRSLATRVTSEHMTRLPLLRRCPTLFQEFVDGANCRAHIVFGHLYPLVFESDATDYRATFGESRFSASGLDRVLVSRLCSETEADGLNLCGCDLKWSSTRREWLMLEVNRMPAIDYYDHITGNLVGDAMAEGILQAT